VRPAVVLGGRLPVPLAELAEWAELAGLEPVVVQVLELAQVVLGEPARI